MKKRVHLSFLRTLRTDISPSFNINSRHQLNIISNTRHEYNRSLLSSMFLVRLKAAFTPRFLFFSFLSLLSLSLQRTQVFSFFLSISACFLFADFCRAIVVPCPRARRAEQSVQRSLSLFHRGIGSVFGVRRFILLNLVKDEFVVSPDGEIIIANNF